MLAPFRRWTHLVQDTNGFRESNLRVSDFLVELVRLESEGRLVEASSESLRKVPVLEGDKVFFVLNRPASEPPVFVSEIIVAAPVSRFRGAFGSPATAAYGYVPVLRLLRDRADAPWQEQFRETAVGSHMGV